MRDKYDMIRYGHIVMQAYQFGIHGKLMGLPHDIVPDMMEKMMLSYKISASARGWNQHENCF